MTDKPEEFFTVEQGNKVMAVFFLCSNAAQHYVAARVTLQNFLVLPGVLLAEQSIETFIKAIIRTQGKHKYVHNLVELLSQWQNRVPYFQQLLTDQRMVNFLTQLENAYKLMRYGEAKSHINTAPVVQLLDELAFNLRTTYYGMMNVQDVPPLFVPQQLQHVFLRENSFFTADDITAQSIASYGMVMSSDFLKGLDDWGTV